MNEIDFLEQQAIEAAVKLRWNEAIEINKKILALDKKNLSALLRLGYCYWQLGKLKEAKSYYLKVRRLQPGNQLAKENLERIKVLEGKRLKKIKEVPNLDPNLFIESPGKTKSVKLINLGQKNILAQLMIGQEVILRQKKRKIEVRTRSNEYIGSLPDDISKRLILFLKAGSQYRGFIKEAEINRVVIFIREEKKGKKVMNYPSFPKTSTENILKVQNAEEATEPEEEEIAENDLEKLAEIIANEEKDYLPFSPEEEPDEDMEE
ncbi:MAG: tetratricopeptide repeat protein [Microgenomates group bacterium]|nr:tetratricopeptide repeat protein [Microgenomates group bacterium]